MFRLIAVALADCQESQKGLVIPAEAGIQTIAFVGTLVNRALRQIGKRNRRLNRLAIAEARAIQRLDAPSARWIAADALRELQDPAVRARIKSR